MDGVYRALITDKTADTRKILIVLQQQSTSCPKYNLVVVIIMFLTLSLFDWTSPHVESYIRKSLSIVDVMLLLIIV